MMAKIIVFDDRGSLYFNSKEDLIDIRNTVVTAVREAKEKKSIDLIQLEDNTELILYTLDDDNKPYRWSSESETIEPIDWLGKDKDGNRIVNLFNEETFLICDYSWNSAINGYENALYEILTDVRKSTKRIVFLLYSTVLQEEAQDFLEDEWNKDFPKDVIATKEVIGFGETKVAMRHSLKSRIKYVFRQ